MEQLIQKPLLDLYLQYKAEFEEHEEEFETVSAKAQTERDKNREIASRPLGGDPHQPQVRWQDALESKEAVYNQHYDRMHRSRKTLLDDVLSAAEMEYLDQALKLIDSWNQLIVVKQLHTQATDTFALGQLRHLESLSIPSTNSEVMGGRTHMINHKPELVAPRHEQPKRPAMLERLRELLDI